MCRFLFPSNGKAFPNLASAPVTVQNENAVSIPFKREGVSKHTCKSLWLNLTRSFYSLQTGRRFQTKIRTVYTRRSTASFYSLQTGRRFQTKEAIMLKIRHEKRFYSLQTGRRFQTTMYGNISRMISAKVSIPFNREGVSKPYAFEPLCA